MGSAGDSHVVDYLVVGAGPAGIQMGYEMTRDNASHVVLEKAASAGDFFKSYPRHRTLISLNKKYNILPEADFNMRHDWNSLLADSHEKPLLFTDYTDELFPCADILVTYLEDFVKKYGINVQYNTEVVKIGKNANGSFTVRTNTGSVYTCKAVLLGTGCIKDMTPDIPGIELADTYAGHTLDKDVYRNKKVCIIGAKNSAFETADYLAGTAGIVHMYTHSDIKMAWDTHFVGDLRAVNNGIIDMFHLKSLHAVASNAHIEKVTKVKGPQGQDMLKMNFNIDLPHWSPPSQGAFDATYDKIIFATGWKYIQPEIFEEDCVPATHGPQGKFPVLSESWESSVEGVYYMGTNMQSRDKQSASGFIHGFRYNVRSLYHILRHKYEGKELWKETFNQMNVDKLVDFIIKRISTTSALYQLNQGFLCDVAVFRDGQEGDEKSWKVDYYYELPQAWVHQNPLFNKEKNVWVICMGDQRKRFATRLNPLEFSKPPDFKFENNVCQPYNEAFVRWFECGNLKDAQNMGATLTVRYDFANLSGQKAERPYNKLKNLIARMIGVGSTDNSEAFFDEAFFKERITVWSQERIEQQKIKEQVREGQCDLHLNRHYKNIAKA